MPNRGPFPTSNIDFNTYLQTAVPYLTTNAARLGISAGHVADIAALLLLWNPIFAQSENPATATTTSKHQRDTYRSDFETLLRDIYHDIPQSVLTQTDRDTLNLPTHDAVPTPVTVPTVAPTVTIEKMSHLQHILRFQNPETPDSHAKPAGVTSVEIYGYMMNNPNEPPMPGPLPTEDNFHHIAGTGKFLYAVNFEMAQVGKTIYYLARYRNSRGEVGPYSVMINAMVG